MQKLPSGTKRTAKSKSKDNDLSADKIIDIINICNSNNVRNFKYGPLEITFSDSASGCACVGKVNRLPEVADPSPEPASIHVTEEEREDIRLAQLMIDDPQAFEQEVIDSHTGRSNA